MKSKPKVGDKVYDRWWTWWGKGIVVKALKTRWHIRFHRVGVMSYDRAHLQFLERA